MTQQQTLNSQISLSGRGLHTGAEINLTICPADVNTGIVFQRIDLEGEPKIAALAENVSGTLRGTVLKSGEAEISTVEHCLSALYAVGIDNAIIKVDAPEVPILDGSAAPFVKAINEAGIVAQDADRDEFVVTKKISYHDDESGADILILPDDEFSVEVHIDYDSKVISNQYAILNSLKDYEKQIASARTFVFVRELEPLLKENLIRGGDFSNALVVYDGILAKEELNRLSQLLNKPLPENVEVGYLGNQPTSNNEAARHKLLDLVGDLALIGKRIVGRVIATHPGHSHNTKLAKQIRKELKRQEVMTPIYNPELAPVMDVNRIKSLLPHRYPFLLVDKVIDVGANSIVTVKNITFNEMQFLGHFPNEPVMPGVLQIEAMAQSAGLLVLSQIEVPENYSTYFLKINNVKFRNKVVPGDTMVMKVMLMSPVRRGLSDIKGYVFVGGKIVAEAEMVAQIAKNK